MAFAPVFDTLAVFRASEVIFGSLVSAGLLDR
jgi:hypothetical protein